MAHPTQDADAIMRRYETHQEKMMTFVVTRQGQIFTPNSDLSLVDLEFVSAKVELVGEPGVGENGFVNTGFNPDTASYHNQYATYNCSINRVYGVNDEGVSSRVYNSTQPNKIVMHQELHHGYVDISIEGMTQGRHFLQDDSNSQNSISLLAPTDLGLLSLRHQTNITPQILQNVKLEQKLRIHTSFLGNGSREKRQARFVEDFADTNPSLYRKADGTVNYWDGTVGQGQNSKCIIPSNCINLMILQFKVKPRSTV